MIKAINHSKSCMMAVVFILMGCLLLSGCGKVSLFNMVVKVQHQQERGEWYVVKEVRHGDYFKAVASYTWSTTGSGGLHRTRWDVYQDGQLVRRGKDLWYNFTSSPFTVYLTFDSSALKLGPCELVPYLDGEKQGTITAKIVKKTTKEGGVWVVIAGCRGCGVCTTFSHATH